MMRFYGFAFADGTHTTTGGQYRVKLHIAGQLYSFESKAARNEWVSEGYNYPVPRDWGQFRRAVTTRDLPMGWNRREADPDNKLGAEQFEEMTTEPLSL